MIKLDIINEVVNKTGITKTKAEMAVETVFESMKKALEQGDRIELRGFGVFNVADLFIEPGLACLAIAGGVWLVQILRRSRRERADAAAPVQPAS